MIFLERSGIAHSQAIWMRLGNLAYAPQDLSHLAQLKVISHSGALGGLSSSGLQLSFPVTLVWSNAQADGWHSFEFSSPAIAKPLTLSLAH